MEYDKENQWWIEYTKLSTNHESLSQPIMKIGY